MDKPTLHAMFFKRKYSSLEVRKPVNYTLLSSCFICFVYVFFMSDEALTNWAQESYRRSTAYAVLDIRELHIPDDAPSWKGPTHNHVYLRNSFFLHNEHISWMLSFVETSFLSVNWKPEHSESGFMNENERYCALVFFLPSVSFIFPWCDDSTLAAMAAVVFLRRNLNI